MCFTSDKVVRPCSCDLELLAGGTWDGFGARALTIEETAYTRKGRYSIRFRLIAMEKLDEHRKKGFILDEVTRGFST